MRDSPDPVHQTDLVGISSAYGGVLSALEILYTITPKTDHRQEPFAAGRLCVEREEVYAIYPDHKSVITVDQRDIIL